MGPAWRVAAIGPAGERVVRYATISHDGRHAGRGGSRGGAGLQVVQGGHGPRPGPRSPQRTRRPCWPPPRSCAQRSFGQATAKYRELGTMANLLAFNAISALPTRNFSAASFDGAEALSAEQIADLRQVARNSCASCSIGCEHLYKGRGRQEGPDGVRERVRARTAVRRQRPRHGDRRQRDAATSSDWTRSRPAGRSRGRWSAPRRG